MNERKLDDLATVGSALGWSGAAALVVSAVMAYRASDLVAAPLGWLAAWGPAAAIVGVGAASLRVLGPRSRPVIVLGVAAVVCFGPLALFAERIKLVTHHRPLGAATFAVLGALVIVVAIAAVTQLLRQARVPGRSGVMARVCLYAVMGSAALLGVGLLGTAAVEPEAGALLAGILDLGLTATAIAVATVAPPWAWARRPGLSIGFWGSTIALSAAVLASIPASRLVLSQALPSLLPAAGWLGG